MGRPTAVITGGGRGIGRATALRLAKSGYEVFAAARTADQLDETRRLITEAGGQCTCVTADLTDPNQVRALIETAADSAGRVDVLINNAGLAPHAKISQMTGEAFRQLVGININAVFFACQAVWPIMQKQGGGTIINISSLASFDPFPGFDAYGATNAWVNLFTQAAAAEGRADNIRISAGAPGAVETTMLRTPFPDFPADQTLEPDDVATMIETLLDPRCQYATGSVIPIRK